VIKRVVKNDDAGRRWGVLRASLISLALTSALIYAGASAALAAPKGIFAKLAQCPTGRAGVAVCVHAEINGGVLSIGRVSIPIARPIVIQYGAAPTGGVNFNEYFLSPAANGESIAANELEIPGGLRAVLQCPQAGCRGPSGGIVPNAVSARIETAASAANPGTLNMAAIVEEQGAALTLPVRLQLYNSLLGKACYLGSVAHPIELRLTVGATTPPPPNKPITGIRGRPASLLENGYELTSTTGAKLVDNAFSVPVAQGCGEQQASLVDVEIDQAIGLESRAGHNTAILMGTLQTAETESVLASATFPSK
jgi:hypothetical protein